MINEFEYISAVGGGTARIRADKDVSRRCAWHLASIEGNGLPDVSALGSSSYGVAGKSYTGLSVDSRNIVIKAYADAESVLGLQVMLQDAARRVSVGGGKLGTLRLRNAAGEWYRIAAKCTGFEIDKQYVRTALVRFDFDCPYVWFESDAALSAPLIAAGSGKEYPLVRPLDFGGAPESVQPGSSTAGKDFGVTLHNPGDVPCPFSLAVSGSSVTSIDVTGGDGWHLTIKPTEAVADGNGIVVSTDVDGIGCFLDTGGERWPKPSYIYPSSTGLADMQLPPGSTGLTVNVKAGKISYIGSRFEWRGRYSSCL